MLTPGVLQSNKSLVESNLESLAQVVIGEMSEFKDKILRTICKWYVHCGIERVNVFSVLTQCVHAVREDLYIRHPCGDTECQEI